MKPLNMINYMLYYVQCYEHSPLLRYTNHAGFRDEEFISFPRSPDYETRLIKMDPVQYLQRVRLLLPTIVNVN
jgi:hypothetical protein